MFNFIQTAADSLGNATGATVGAAIAAKVALVLGVVLRFLMEHLIKPALARLGKLNAWQKSVAVIVSGQVLAWANAFLSAHGLPSLTTDSVGWATALEGLVVAATAMGFNALLDAVFGRKPAPATAKAKNK